MGWTNFLTDFDKWWIIATFCTSTLFILYYGMGKTWWKTPFGWTLIGMDFGLFLTTLSSFLQYTTGINITNDRTTYIVVIAGLTSIPFIITYRIYLTWQVRHKPFWRQIQKEKTKRRASHLKEHPEDS